MAIPKKLIQFANRGYVDKSIEENIRHIKQLNKGWTHILFDEIQAKEFIENNYGSFVVDTFHSISDNYWPARADLFRYLIMFKFGGVYLDIKSSMSKPLDSFLRESDDYLLSHWGKSFPGWGNHPELGKLPCFQQWFIICSPSHPFLSLTLANVLENIRHYEPGRVGVGKKGVLRLTGTIPYSRSIYRLKNFHPYRIFDSEKVGLIYSIFGTKENPLKHENKTNNHYSRQTSAIIKKVNGTSK